MKNHLPQDLLDRKIKIMAEPLRFNLEERAGFLVLLLLLLVFCSSKIQRLSLFMDLEGLPLHGLLLKVFLLSLSSILEDGVLVGLLKSTLLILHTQKSTLLSKFKMFNKIKKESKKQKKKIKKFRSIRKLCCQISLLIIAPLILMSAISIKIKTQNKTQKLDLNLFIDVY